MNRSPSSSASGSVLRKLALYGSLGLLILYVAGVAGGYTWLRVVRKNEQVGVLDLALGRIGAIRRSIAAQHFTEAQREWDAKNYQVAYLYFSSGVRQDPDNVTGRLTAVRFLRGVGAGSLALAMLEEGLARDPADRRLIEPTFEFLFAAGRHRHALDLLRQRYGVELSGPNGALLQRYEVAATLAVDGAVAAKKLLDKNTGVLRDPQAVPVVVRVLWESQERSRAIGLLQDYVSHQPSAVFADFALLAGWQEMAGTATEAVLTARRASERFPRELAPRVLLIEMIAAENPSGSSVPDAIAAYFSEFSDRPEAITSLAALAGRKGWVELARSLYLVGANRELDASLLAMSYSDALARGSRFKEVAQILAELETQAPEGNPAYMTQLRQRQVIAAAALGDEDNVREYARRLGSLLSRDPDGIEACRGLFRKLGIAGAVAEMTSRSVAVSSPSKK